MKCMIQKADFADIHTDIIRSESIGNGVQKMGYKSRVDWCDSTWSPVTGCLHGCEYCYARRIAERFGSKQMPIFVDYPVLDEPVRCADTYAYMRDAGISAGVIQPYPFDFTPTFHRYKLDEPQHWKKPRNIFVCSMADLFGEWVLDEWIDDVIKATQRALQHRYLFLTKNPERYGEWLERFEEGRISELDEVENCWFGASASNNAELERANRSMAQWVSIEPIRERIETDEDQFMEFNPYQEANENAGRGLSLARKQAARKTRLPLKGNGLTI